jgi:DNA-binding protein HU-beta
MNKTQLIDALAARTGDRRTAAALVDSLLETIVDTVRAGDSVSLSGFGVFESRARAARVARNPRTGAAVDVPATTVPAFRAGLAFRSAVGGSSAGRTATTRKTRAAATPAVARSAETEAAAVADAPAKVARGKGKRSTAAAAKAAAAKAEPTPPAATAKPARKAAKAAAAESGSGKPKGKSKSAAGAAADPATVNAKTVDTKRATAPKKSDAKKSAKPKKGKK